MIRMNIQLKTFPRVTEFCILFLFLISMYSSSGPLLEGYQINEFLNSSNYFEFFPSIANRPLSFIPHLIATSISGNAIFGYFIVNSLLGIVRWHSTSMLRSQFGTFHYHLVLFHSLFLPPWIGVSNERFLPAQLAATLLYAGYCREFSSKRGPLGKTLIVLSAFTYPPIFVLPLVFQLIKICRSIIIGKKINLPDGFLFSFIFTLFFALTSFILGKVLPNNYDSAQTGLPTVSNFFDSLGTIYSKYPSLAFSLLLIIMYSTWLITHNPKSFVLMFVITCSIVPISSVTFSVNNLYVNDPERIFFPISVLLLVLLANLKGNEFESENKETIILLNGKKTSSILLALTLLVSLMLSVQQSIRFQQIQITNQSLVQIINREADGISSLLIKDKSGKLGDVYSFYAPAKVLNSVLSERKISVDVCSIVKRENVPLIADRYPIAGPELCSVFDEKDFDKSLVINLKNNQAVLELSIRNPASR
jgi:hypothetical protein